MPHVDHPAPRPTGYYEATEGEFAGWRSFHDDGFETHNGPFWFRQEADGTMRCAFRIDQRHLNGAGNLHGGCLMAFGDFCLFIHSLPVRQGEMAVTVNFSANFIDAARLGDLVEGTGEVTRAGRSLVFVRGEMATGDRVLFTYSGTIKRVHKKTPASLQA
jgi:uncharacterized protein (TIGR00369 family)